MPHRTLLRYSIAAALGLALDACSVGDFVLRPDGGRADGGGFNPDDSATNPDDRPIVGDAPVTPQDGGTPPGDGGPSPDVTAPVDSGMTGACNVSEAVARALPALNAATTARVREIRAAGLARGNRPNVFTKIGDSITEAAGFMQDLGFGYETDFGRYACLRGTVDYFVSVTFADGNNSFNHPSASAMGGWLSNQPLLGDPSSPLRAELSYTRPLYGIVMIGTNDLASGSLSSYTANLTQIVTIMEEFGTVPVVSTIPDRPEDARFTPLVASFNEAIRGVAAARNLPLVDYWQSMQALPNHGVSDDGIHPSIYRVMGDAQGRQLSEAALQYGYNMRNLTALLMFERLRSLPQ